MAESLFERYGGIDTVREIVAEFYERVLDSAQLHPYFEKAEMGPLVDHQAQFIAALMGGPASFSDEQLHRVHASLDVTPEDFAEMASILQETMEDFDLAFDDVDIVMQAFRAKQPLIVAGRAH